MRCSNPQRFSVTQSRRVVMDGECEATKGEKYQAGHNQLRMAFVGIVCH
jgi:hypothetical protein